MSIEENNIRDIYIRVSRNMGRGGETYHSPKTQEEAVRAYLKRRGLEPGQVRFEEDVSGGKRVKDRGLEELVQRCERGESGGIVSFNVKRFARSLSQGSEAIKRIKDAGGEYSDSYDNSTNGNSLAINIYLSIGEDELEKLTEQWADVRGRVLKAGHWGSPTAPLGYTHPRRRSKLIVDPKLAPVIVELFELRLEGWTIKALWEHLNERLTELGYPPYKAVKGVHKILTNRVYLGELHVEGFEPNLKAHDAIVDRDLFNKVQTMIKPRPGRNAKAPYLLARLKYLRCGNCRSFMSVTHSKGGAVRTSGGKRDGSRGGSTEPWLPTYRCQNASCSHRVAIQANIAEKAVWDWTKAHKTTGNGSVAERSRQAAEEEARAQADLNAYLKLVNDTRTADEPSAVAEVIRLVALRDEKHEVFAQLGGHGTGNTKKKLRILTQAGLDRLEKDDPKSAMDYKRQLITARSQCALVLDTRIKGEGAQRIEIVPFD